VAGVENNAEKSKHVYMFHHLNAGQNCGVKVANKSFEYVEKFVYLGMEIINQATFKKILRTD
jgi:hypothetical protein